MSATAYSFDRTTALFDSRRARSLSADAFRGELQRAYSAGERAALERNEEAGRMKRAVALFRFANLLGVALNPAKDDATLIHELADAFELQLKDDARLVWCAAFAQHEGKDSEECERSADLAVTKWRAYWAHFRQFPGARPPVLSFPGGNVDTSTMKAEPCAHTTIAGDPEDVIR